MAMFTYDDVLAKINSGNEQNNSNATVRLNAIPLDKSTIYPSYEAAVEYAKTAGNAYEGQIIAVTENEFTPWACTTEPQTPTPSFTVVKTEDTYKVEFSNGVVSAATASVEDGTTAGGESLKLTLNATQGDLAVPAAPGTGEGVELTFERTYGATQNVYVLDHNAVNCLKKINGTGSGSSTSSSGDVEAEKARAMAVENKLSADMIAANQNLSVSVEERGTPKEGYLKTYQIKQGDKTYDIDIPKDFLVRSGSVITPTEDQVNGELSGQGLEAGKQYLDLVVNTVEGKDEAQHIYIAVSTMVENLYTVEENAAQVQLGIDNKNKISATLVAGSVGTTELSDKAVTTAKIGDNAVTTGQLADNAVTTAKIEAGAVTGGKIAGNAISAEHISEKAVGTNQLADDAVTNDKIADNAVNTVQIAASAVTGEKIAANAVGKDKLSEELQTVLTSLAALSGASLEYDTDANATYVVTTGGDGRLVASQKAIAISQSQITDLAGKTLVDTSMVAPLTGDETARSDLIARESTVDTKIDTALTVLGDYVTNENLDGKLTNYVPTSAVVDAANENDKIVRQSTLDTGYLKTADFNTISTTIGLNAASNDNKVATISDLTALDVEGKIDDKLGQLTVQIDAGKTITAIKQNEKGAVTVETADIAIEQSAVNGLTGSLQALSDQVYTLNNGLNDYVKAENFDTYAKTAGMDRATENDKLVISSDVRAALNKALGALDDYVPTSAVYDFKKVTNDDKLVISSDVSAAIDTAIKGIGDVLHFKGVASIVGENGVPVAVGEGYEAGDVVLDSKTSKEFVVVKTSTEGEPKLEFREIGDEHLIDQYVAKTTKINGKALTSDITLSGGDIKVGGKGDYALSTVEEAVTDIDGRVDTLSTAVKNKVKVGDYGSELTSVDQLSVVRIEGETYHDLVKTNGIDPNTVYIVQSDEANMYGERVTNVAEAVADTDVVTLGQTKRLVQDALTSVEVIDCGNAKA